MIGNLPWAKRNNLLANEQNVNRAQVKLVEVRKPLEPLVTRMLASIKLIEGLVTESKQRTIRFL